MLALGLPSLTRPVACEAVVSQAEVYDAKPFARAPVVPPRPLPASETMTTFQRLAALRSSAIASWGQRAYEEDVIRGNFLGRKSFILNTADAIRHVLIENYENYTRTPVGFRVLRPILGREGLLLAEGRAWKHQRRTLAPAFSPRAVTMLAPHMRNATEDAITELERACGAPVDLREAMQRLALDIAGRTMFSFEIDRHGAALRGYVTEYGNELARPHFLDLLLPLSWPSPRDLSRALFRRRWSRFMHGLVAERRAMTTSDAPPRDLFDLMINAHDPETGETFSNAQLVDQVSTMILAGHETTATALFWSLYVLALDPATQDAVAAEANAAGKVPSLERLKFTRAVLDEILRLYPPAFLIARAAAGPDVIAGFPVAPKDVILIAPWLLHRHAKHWDNPHAFCPERFLEGAPPPDRFAYLPFGVGPRVCIGAQFALTEATLALARIIGTFRVELLDSEPVMPLGVVTTQPDRSPAFQITRR